MLVLPATGGEPHRVQLELARTPEARARGLMGRPSVSADEGMLFDFGAEVVATMWMRNTPASLDILFLTPDGHIVNRYERTVPFSDTLLPSARPVRYALELAAGESARAGLKAGVQVTLPAACR